MAFTQCYQKLSPWLTEPVSRLGRVYLETHLELLASEYEHFLALFISKYSDSPEEQTWLRIHQHLLLDARKRGSTACAVRAAYVNVYGGLILDLPPQLIGIERELRALTRAEWTDRVFAVSKMRLNKAVERTSTWEGIAPEIVAELDYQLGKLFTASSPRYSRQVLGKIIDYYEHALQVYTRELYPLQHTKVLVALGEAYTHCCTELWVDHLDKAMSCYRAALHSYYNTAASVLVPTR